MNKKKGILISIAILIVVAIGAIIFFVFRNSNLEYQDLGKIRSIKYTVGKEEYELVKEEECWYWEDRKDLSVDEDFIETQAKIARKELEIIKEEEKGSFKKYGLDDTEYSLTLKDSKGRKYEIHIGNMVSEDTYFVRIGNEKSIYTASWKIMEVIDSLAAQRLQSEQMEVVE